MKPPQHFQWKVEGKVGVITLKSVLSLDRQKWHWLHVASVMEPVTPKNAVAPDSSAADALEMMQRQGQDMLLVAENGRLRGAVAFPDLASYVSISMKVDNDRPVRASR